jgi:hypothetical protein
MLMIFYLMLFRYIIGIFDDIPKQIQIKKNKFKNLFLKVVSHLYLPYGWFIIIVIFLDLFILYFSSSDFKLENFYKKNNF